MERRGFWSLLELLLFLRLAHLVGCVVLMVDDAVQHSLGTSGSVVGLAGGLLPTTALMIPFKGWIEEE